MKMRLLRAFIINIVLMPPIFATTDNQVYAFNQSGNDIKVIAITQSEKRVSKTVKAGDREWLHLGDECVKYFQFSMRTLSGRSITRTWLPKKTSCSYILVLNSGNAGPQVMGYSPYNPENPEEMSPEWYVSAYIYIPSFGSTCNYRRIIRKDTNMPAPPGDIIHLLDQNGYTFAPCNE